MKADMATRFMLHAQLLWHRRSVERARGRITRWLELVRHPYVAFSTGKDSVCVLHLVREQAPDVPAVYFDAECAFPESKSMLDSIENMIVYPAEEPLLETFRRFGGFEGGAELERETMRTTVWEPVRRLVAEYAFDGMAYGLRAEESRGRAMHAQCRGAVFQYKRDGLWGCQPIHDWIYDDVWAFIVSNGLAYCGVYDRLWDLPQEDQRLSYWAGSTKRRWGRWAVLKRYWPELFNRLAAEFPEVRSYV